MVVVIDAKNVHLAEALAGTADVRLLPTPAITRSALLDADAVIVRSETRVGPHLLTGTKVRFVGTATIGTDHIDTEYLQREGIVCASAPGSNANSVAEYVAAALLVVAERLGVTLAGTTLGVIGVGNVGSRVVRVGRALGMKVVQHDPPLARATGDPVFVPLAALEGADVITLHVPLTRRGTDPTWHLADEEFFARMKRGVIVLNTSRGAVVESTALMRALGDGHVTAAVLDVWEQEPAIDMDLLQRTAVGTPHIAGYSLDGKINAARMMFDALVTHVGAAAQWEPPHHLPPPASPELVAPRGVGHERALQTLVTTAYDIVRDDTALRALPGLPAEERSAAFQRLRAHYPVRREFAATRVTVPEEDHPLRAALAALGFGVRLGDRTPPHR